MTGIATVRALTPRPSAAFLERVGLLPVERTTAGVVVASWHATPEASAIDELALLFGAPITVIPGDEHALRAAIHRVYGEESTAQGVIDALDAPRNAATSSRALDDLVAQANEAPIVRLVNLLLVEALDARASDVHLEATGGALRVRYRIDGVLQDAPSPPASSAAAVVSRLKIMAELDIAERRVPQDGRVRLRLQERMVDVRVATVPTLHGESIVLRLLDRAQGPIALDAIGMPAPLLARFRAAIARPHGIVLATGPTGSGKTTTLYAAIDAIRTGREKILTVEDPVEYELVGVPQVPVHEKAGVTFATALRALLRQDPDVLLVGEIRDEETAAIATQAALTGHLVLSTLHTNDAIGALVRLRDLGVAPYLIASTVQVVLAQRLVRRICPSCANAGCDACRGTGYRGRAGVYELFEMTDAIRDALGGGADTSTLRRLAADAGLSPLVADAERLVAAGVTTASEAARIALM